MRRQFLALELKMMAQACRDFFELTDFISLRSLESYSERAEPFSLFADEEHRIRSRNRVALVGMGKMRGETQFNGLPLNETSTQLECCVVAVELESGQILCRFLFTSACTRVFDVQILAAGKMPMILNHQQPESKQACAMRSVSFGFASNSKQALKPCGE